LLLGLDIGTSRIKALLMDADGNECRAARTATPFDDGEMSADRLLAAVAGAVAELGSARADIAAVGVAGIAESGAPVAGDGRPLAPIIAWHDPRGGEIVERLQQRFGPELEESIGQRLRVVSSVAKLGWLVERGLGPVAGWLGVPELVLHDLTGRRVTEFSLAARTGAYHVGEHRYLPEVAGAIGVSPDVFAEVAAAGTVMGRVSEDAASRWGLPAGIPVTIAGHDHLVARAGSGARPRDLVNSVGTAETVVTAAGTLPDVGAALARRVAVSVLPGGAGWALLASAARAGLVLTAVAAALGRSVDELDAMASGAGGATIDESVIEAALSDSPLDLPAAPAAEIWNGVLGYLAARTWDACDRLAGVAPVAREAGGHGLVVCGGGSRSRPWLHAKAAARPAMGVWRSGAVEAVVRGAALYAGVAAGWWAAVGSGPQLGLERVVI
jgi:xylulokinase